MLRTHYRQPIDWTIRSWKKLQFADAFSLLEWQTNTMSHGQLRPEFIEALVTI